MTTTPVGWNERRFRFLGKRGVVLAIAALVAFAR